MKKILLLFAIMLVGLFLQAQDTTYTKLSKKQVLVEIIDNADTTYAVYTQKEINAEISNLNVQIDMFVSELVAVRFYKQRLIAIRDELNTY